MPWRHLLLGLAVVAVWGTNFVVIKLGLAELPPFLFVALRFYASALPMLVLARPRTAWPPLIAYGLLIGMGQFGLLFYAMRADITPGLASLVVQMQVFFTIGLSALVHHERLRPAQAGALALAVAGMGVIAWHVGAAGAGGGAITLFGVGVVLLAALCWGVGNLVVKRVGRVDMLAFMAWSSLWPALGLSLVSLGLEGPQRVVHALGAASGAAWAAVAWQALGNTLFGFAAWSWLLTRHPAATVTPLALGVPVFGMGASALVLGETLPPWKIGAAALVMLGLALNVWAGRRAARA